MDDQTHDVVLTGPAKVGGEVKLAGAMVAVTRKHALQLEMSGALPLGTAERLPRPDAAALTSDAFEQAVAAKAQELAEAVTGAAIEAAIAERIGGIENEADARIALLEGEHRAELEVLDHELDAAKVRISELEAKVSAETSRADAAEAALVASKADKSGKPAK